MVSTVILTHGGLAEELLQAARTIVGEMPRFHAVTLDWDDSFEEASRKTELALQRIDAEDEVLILTDMYGGTPYNVAAAIVEAGRLEVVTGVNLPMVVRLGCPDVEGMDVGQLATWIQAKARRSICRAGEGNGNSSESGN